MASKVTEMEQVSDEAIAAYCLRLERLKCRVYDMKVETEAIKSRLEAALNQRGKDDITVDGWHVKRSTYSRSQLDAQRLRKEHPKIYAACQMQVTVSRLEWHEVNV